MRSLQLEGAAAEVAVMVVSGSVVADGSAYVALFKWRATTLGQSWRK